MWYGSETHFSHHRPCHSFVSYSSRKHWDYMCAGSCFDFYHVLAVNLKSSRCHPVIWFLLSFFCVCVLVAIYCLTLWSCKNSANLSCIGIGFIDSSHPIIASPCLLNFLTITGNALIWVIGSPLLWMSTLLISEQLAVCDFVPLFPLLDSTGT